jgi:uncharacterized membrane protein YciS (DUF1049 family)
MFMNAVPGIRLIQTLLIRITWSALTMGLILGVLICSSRYLYVKFRKKRTPRDANTGFALFEMKY